MKAISLTQPWASLVACGAKRYETRARWHYKHRGLVAVCATKEVDREVQKRIGYIAEDCGRMDVSYAMAGVLPLASVVAVADLVDVQVMDADLILEQDRLELAVGDWQLGRYALRLENVRALPTPFAVRGALGCFEIPVALRELGL